MYWISSIILRKLRENLTNIEAQADSTNIILLGLQNAFDVTLYISIIEGLYRVPLLINIDGQGNYDRGVFPIVTIISVR